MTIADEDCPHPNVSAAGRVGQAPSSIDHIRLFTPGIDVDIEVRRDSVSMCFSNTASR
ncbi:hypothetical protein [Haloferax sp. ATB1]|uniref:hypothetical protein n=1 Tax=Haloferax sp. ATB1 TaxID=1508454 RepID=UPI000A6C9BEB|nr:hypothetical protein [Haloferax sp. ATB1]